MVLGLLGCLVDSAMDGSEALRKIREQPGRFTLLLTDHKMLPMDGLSLVRELRASGFGGKIMVLSGCLENADRAAYLELAVDGIMSKPFDIREFRSAIIHLMSDIRPVN